MATFFPENSAEALAMLYLEKQDDIKSLTPEELADRYDEVVNKIIAQQLLIRRGKSSLPVLKGSQNQAQ
ncbi:MAG: hypothetical protein K6B74_05035 [Ruminococcus sp.]|nr:hypothetical protein [Ruminococcus sp.]